MQAFFRFGLVYFLFAATVSYLLAGNSLDPMVGSMTAFMRALIVNTLSTVLIFVAVLIAFVRYRGQPVFNDIVFAIVGLAFFSNGFAMLKTSMSQLSGFWADPMLAELDRWMHFGVDPWVITHLLSPWIHAGIADLFYLRIWIAVAVFFPVLIAALDRNLPKRNAYVILYAIAWAFCGNVLALPFLSGGPIYLEALHGMSDFDGLHAALADAGHGETTSAKVQKALLFYYLNGHYALGTGISAFPSVHVAVAAVIAFYLHDTFRTAAASVLGFGFLSVILFLSVWLGWHYAVDGYASIAVMAAARHIFVVRKGLAGSRAAEPGPAAGPVTAPETAAVTSIGYPRLQND